MRGAQQLAGETAAQYLERLESELEEARSDLVDLQDDLDNASRRETERVDKLRKGFSAAERERDFLREQLTDLQLHVASKSAPRRKSQLARLLAGLLRREDWRNGTWR